MIAALLPRGVAVAEALGEPRERHRAAGRECAANALARIGADPTVHIGRGERGEPLWPPGIAGSITHCEGYVAAAVASTGHVAALGIDAEPLRPLPEGVLEEVASPAERERLAGDPVAELVLFSAKEAIYKAWFPLARRWLGFKDVDLTLMPDGTFHADVLVDGPVARFDGRWATTGTLVQSSTWISPAESR